MARGRMPSHRNSSVSTIAASIITLDWLNSSSRPNSPNTGWSSNWLSALMVPPDAANSLVP
jgi:hypothetical protein